MSVEPGKNTIQMSGHEEGEPVDLQPNQAAANPVDTTLSQEARVVLKRVHIPNDDGPIPEDLQRKICDTVLAHIAEHKIVYREIGLQIGFSESTVSEVLRGVYVRAECSPILRKLNAWIEEDARRRASAQPIGFYPTSVFDAIKGLAKYCKSNARITGSTAKDGGTVFDPPRIAIGWGPAGCGKSLGAEALHAEDPLSILIRIKQKAGTDYGVARATIQAAGWRGRPKERGAIEFLVDKLRNSGRLLIVDEAHRLNTSGCELLRDLADVCGIPILLLATQEFYTRLTSVRTRSGHLNYDQFSRRVGYVCDLVKGLDGQGGTRRPIFSLDEVRAIFRVDNIRVTHEGLEYLYAAACTVGLGMLGLAASIFEKALRTAVRRNRVIDEALLRVAAQRVLLPAGDGGDSEVLRIIDQTLISVRRAAIRVMAG